MKNPTPDIIGRECRFSVHIPSKGDSPDIHLVKEVLHTSTGTLIPSLRLIKDFKRTFYVTKKQYRNHQQKKECEQLEHLAEYTCTQSKLRDSIAKVLEKPWSKDSFKKLNRSPYTYGTDISSTSLIKQLYKKQYPDLKSKYSVAAFDIETDVIHGTREAILATITFEDKCFTAVLKSYVQGFSGVEERFQSLGRKYIGDYLDKHHMVPELYIAEDVVDLIRATIQKAHEWKPDFLAIWNVNFDIPEILRMLKEHNVDPRTIFCDPSIPQEYQICKYRQGMNKKMTASGKISAIPPEQQWHTLVCTSSFYVIDAMCTYKYIRLANQKERSYSLDSILNKELGIRKLKFKEADQYTGLQLHQVMQRDYKFEYMIYNIFDCISMLELDIKTKDLGYTLPTFAGFSDFSIFNSQPKRITISYYFYLLDKGYILGSLGAMETEEEIETKAQEQQNTYESLPDALDDEDSDILSLDQWIVTLPAHLTTGGLRCIEEDDTIQTNIRCKVFDADIVSSYPTVTEIANVSKETTKREVIDIEGIEEDVFRIQNMNMVLGHTNSLEYVAHMFGLPKAMDILSMLT